MAHNLVVARWTARIGLGQQIVTTKTLRRRVFALAGRITRSARRLNPASSPALALGGAVQARPGPTASHSTPSLTAPVRHCTRQPTQRPRKLAPSPVRERLLPCPIPTIIARHSHCGRHRCPQKRLQTAREPPRVPKFEPGSCAPVTPSPRQLSSRRPSLSIG